MSSEESQILSVNRKESRLKRWFRTRDLLIRSQGKVRFIRLTPMRQAMLATVFSGGMIWSLGGTIVNYVQSNTIDNQEVIIAEAAIAGQKLHNDFYIYQKELMRVSALLRQKEQEGINTSDKNITQLEELREFEALVAKIQRDLGRALIEIPVSKADQQKIVASRQDLLNQIMDLRKDIQLSQKNTEKLKSEISENNELITVQQKKNLALTENENILNERVNQLTQALNEVREQGQKDKEYIANLENSVSEKQNQIALISQENEKLNTSIAMLSESENLLKSAKREALVLTQTLTQRLAQLNAHLLNRKETEYTETGEQDLFYELAKLSEHVGDVAELATRNQNELNESRQVLTQVNRTLANIAVNIDLNNLHNVTDSEKTKILAQDIAQIQESQLGLINELTERTEQAITITQQTLENTGIDMIAALQLAGFHSGVGGPLNELEANDKAQPAEALKESIAQLEYKMNHLQALDRLAGCVPFVSPLDYYHVTSSFGKRKDPFTGKRAMHKGIDLGGWPGSNVYATAGGHVIRAGNTRGYGKMVEIDHGCGVTTIYGHLKKITVKKGDKISHREVVGKLGSTGRSTGPHVHYEIRLDGEPQNPAKFIEAGKFAYKS